MTTENETFNVFGSCLPLNDNSVVSSVDDPEPLSPSVLWFSAQSRGLGTYQVIQAVNFKSAWWSVLFSSQDSKYMDVDANSPTNQPASSHFSHFIKSTTPVVDLMKSPTGHKITPW